MRMPKYISPSSLSKWESNREDFYVRYLSDVKTERPPQEDYMAMGSAFDAFVKSQIHTDVYGSGVTQGSQFDFTKLFESQVEPHVRDVVLPRAKDLFDQYVESGAYGNLLADIIQSPYGVQMEFTIAGEVQGVPLSGKPDLRFITPEMVHVIGDWKVNGSMSKTGASPEQGYKVARDTYGSNTHGKAHKKYQPSKYKDVELNGLFLEDFSEDWADQLSIYAWVLGEDVGSENFVVRMEQVACRPVKDRPLPRAKFATHMARVSKRYQEKLIHRIHDCWNTLKSGHIFTDRSREESDELCDLLDGKQSTPKGLHPVLAAYASETTRFKG